MSIFEMVIVGFLIFVSGLYIGYAWQKVRGKQLLQKEQEERVQHLIAYWLSKQSPKEEVWGGHSEQIVEHALRKAIEDEDYEDAANLRDILKKMKDGHVNPFDDQLDNESPDI
tara:strand:- start:172 stop:510 length:339 start_codon:yes stop_codon:yes gene_type:complete